jgi:hypothetical protein
VVVHNLEVTDVACRAQPACKGQATPRAPGHTPPSPPPCGDEHSPCFCITCRNLTITLEFGRMSTCNGDAAGHPRLSAPHLARQTGWGEPASSAAWGLRHASAHLALPPLLCIGDRSARRAQARVSGGSALCARGQGVWDGGRHGSSRLSGGGGQRRRRRRRGGGEETLRGCARASRPGRRGRWVRGQRRT